jgi:hypothetical protein
MKNYRWTQEMVLSLPTIPLMTANKQLFIGIPVSLGIDDQIPTKKSLWHRLSRRRIGRGKSQLFRAWVISIEREAK